MPARHVIVGSGIAGLSAAEALRQRQPDAAITLVSEEPHDFYSRPGLAYLLRGDVPEKQLFIRSRADLAALKLDRVHARVEQILCDRREVLLAGGKRLGYDRLVLATGALAVPPSFPGSDLQGLVKLDSLDDARTILKLARRGKTAVVIGGGITALELVEGLSARRMRVHYFMRSARYWGDVLDETESRIVLERLQHEGVIIHTNTQVKEALGRRGRLTAVGTQAGERIACDLLAVAIGVRPRIDLARSAGLKVDRGIAVNAYLETSQPGVYAAGDAAQVEGSPLDVLWPTALAQGRVAGANMAGERRKYARGVACNVTMLTGLKVTIIGAVGGGQDRDLVSIVRGDSESWRARASSWVLADDKVNRVRLFVGERTLVGALVMGDQTWSRPLRQLIAAQVDVTAVRQQLLQDGATALTHLANFYQHWQRSVREP
jgi:NAD(P)H-nitrite reductase large subunit